MPTINAHLHLPENSPAAQLPPRGSRPQAFWPRRTAALAAAVGAAVLLCLTMSLATAPGAAAHDQLISSNPSHGQKFAEAPPTLEFLFSGQLMDIGTEVSVMDGQGKDWASGKPSTSGEKLTQALAAGMPDGEYRASWRVVSSDGHPISGILNFLVGDATALGAPPAAAASPTSQVQPGSTAAAKPGADAPATAISSQLAAGSEAGSGLPKALIVALGAVAGLGAYVAFVFITRARKKS